MLRNDAGGFKTNPVQRCTRDDEPNFVSSFFIAKQGTHVPFLPLISWENTAETSSAVVANENDGTADILLLDFEKMFR
jgi:hypothetical protein